MYKLFGEIYYDSHVKVFRNDAEIFDGQLSYLRNNYATAGLKDYGVVISIVGFSDFRIDDVVKVYFPHANNL